MYMSVRALARRRSLIRNQKPASQQVRLHLFLIFFLAHRVAAFLDTFFAHLLLRHEPRLSKRTVHADCTQRVCPASQASSNDGRHEIGSPPTEWTQMVATELDAPSVYTSQRSPQGGAGGTTRTMSAWCWPRWPDARSPRA